ncbi:MAG: GvpL/GvpF family gas vesicle protein [Deltaproteobacteria bacterium]|nr:GvpL/GvpF family gas vesicle protein [Deltaproteobacteria bacterium]
MERKTETAEGCYLYCIMGSGEARSCDTAGIGGRGDVVSIINYEDLSCATSPSPLGEYAVTRENLMAHQKVVEEAMKDHTVLPVRFSTIAKSPDDIRGVLRKRYAEFKSLYEKMEGKVELGLKALWKDMGRVFKDIAEEDMLVKRLKDRTAGALPGKGFDAGVELGRAVKAALERKKEETAGKIISAFRDISVDFRTNKTHGDNMALNAAFLVNESDMVEFDRRVKELDSRGGGDISLRYVGPVPPFNFVNIVIEWN